MKRFWAVAGAFAVVAACTSDGPPVANAPPAPVVTAALSSRSIADIVERFEAARAQARQQKAQPADEADGSADAETRRILASSPGDGLDAKALADFHRRRANAAGRLGRADRELADRRLAATHAATARLAYASYIFNELAFAEYDAGNVPAAFAALDTGVTHSIRADNPNVIGLNTQKSRWLSFAGRVTEARASLAVAESQMQGFLARPNNAVWLEDFRGLVEEARATLEADSGKLPEAEKAARLAINDAMVMQRKARTGQVRSGAARVYAGKESLRRSILSSILANRRQLVEAEIERRRALEIQLENYGAVTVGAAYRLVEFSGVLFEQGRYAEAEKLQRLSVDVLNDIGVPPSGAARGRATTWLGATLVRQGRYGDALKEYRALEAAYKNAPALYDRDLAQNLYYAVALLETGNPLASLPLLDRRAERATQQWGPNSLALALARGVRGEAYLRLGDRDRAWSDFQAALPQLVRGVVGNADASPVAVEQLRQTVYSYAVDFLVSLRATPLRRRAALEPLSGAPAGVKVADRA